MNTSLNFEPVNVDGVEIVNTTPHPITFGVGKDLITVPTHVIVNAAPEETFVKEEKNAIFISTTFVKANDGIEIIAAIKKVFPNAIIVGSIIAAQAFPGDVVAMTPLPGFERVAPSEKRMNPHKFTIFDK